MHLTASKRGSSVSKNPKLSLPVVTRGKNPCQTLSLPAGTLQSHLQTTQRFL